MRRSETAVLAAILGGAAALRAAAAAIAFDPDIVFVKFPLLANRLIDSGWLAREPFAYSPAYTYLLALLIRLGASQAWMCGVQAALGVAICGLVWAIARRLFGSTVGLASAAGAAVFGPFLLASIELESDGLGLFLYCAAALAFLRAIDRPSTWRFVVAGLLLGLRAIQRPDAVLLLVLVAVFLVAIARGDEGRRAALGSALVYAVAALGPVLPIAWQNKRASGELIPVTSSGGWALYTSHNWAARGLSYFPPPLAMLLMETPAGTGATAGQTPANGDATGPEKATAAREAALDRLDDRVSRRVASLAAGRELSPGKASRFWRHEALRSIERRGFSRQSALQARKLFYMFHAYDAQDSLPTLLKEDRLGWLTFAGMGFLASFAFVGLIMAFATGYRLSRARLPWLAFLLAPILSMSLFYVGARFRLELAAMLMPLAGLAIVRLASFVQDERWRMLLGTGVLVVVLAAWLHSPNQEIARQQRMRYIQLHTFLGERAETGGAALEEFGLATSVAVYPAEATSAWRGLARIERARGNEKAAARAQRTASGIVDGRTHARLARMPDDPDARFAIGVHFMQRGEMERAADALADAARLAPDDPDVVLARALAGFEAGALPADRTAALVEDALTAGLRFSPNAVTGYRLAARCYERLGDRDKTQASEEHARRYQAFISDLNAGSDRTHQ